VMRWALAVGRIQTGGVSSEWQPHHVLEMATMEGARALGLAGEIGSLVVGKKADLVVLDFRRPHLTPCVNPLGNLIHTAQGRDVETVIVDGQILVESGSPRRASESDVREEATRAVRRLWDRA
nr:amidohydrolase family protein [Acidobacteriota bacterium]